MRKFLVTCEGYPLGDMLCILKENFDDPEGMEE